MFDRIYIEEAVWEHPRAIRITERYPNAERIICERYGEVFNPKRQNFRLQKQNPSLVLAEKRGKRVLPTPPDYGLGADKHFYFSHMLNCLYDCRYCFLQGMYQSANYILFVNFEDFLTDIHNTLDSHANQECFFFSGYDCDSLAMEGMTRFTESFLPFFESRPNGWLELRTKSINTSPLLRHSPIPNVVAAFSLNPDCVARSLEHKAPPVGARLTAIKKLTDAGWKIGLRIDPLIYFENCDSVYERFLDHVFKTVPLESIHSVTLGTFRAPKNIFKKMESLYPEEPLFMSNLQLNNGMVGYKKDIEFDFLKRLETRILKHIPQSVFFPCQ